MRIVKEDCAGLVIDIQERLRPVMDEGDQLVRKVAMLLEGLRVLEVPILVTEQYPKGLGPTIENVRKLIPSFSPVEKVTFSCLEEPAFQQTLGALSGKTIIICGIEAHVCVLQTVVDLIGEGYQPVVVADCISSRNPVDITIALERMKMEGAIVTTCESILFELLVKAGTAQFKAISRLVK